MVNARQAACAFAVLSTIVLALPATNADDQSSRVTTIPVPDHGQPAAAKTDAEGTIHLLFNTQDGPRYATSRDHGKSFSDAMPVVVDRDALKVDPRVKFEGCDMALGQGGRIHVGIMTPNAWMLKVPQSDWGLYFARLEPGAKSFSPVRRLNGKPSEGFSLAADDQGNVSACWLADKLYCNVSHDNGESFEGNEEINPAYDPCNCCTTSAAFGADGNLAVLYREETNDERDMYLLLWNQQRNQTSRTRISSTLWKIDSCPMSYFAVSRAPRGFVAAWPTGDQYDIYFARVDQRGRVLPPGEIRTPGRAGHRTGILALSAPDGSSLVAWTKENRLGWQLYDAQGKPDGHPGSAATSGSGVAGVVDGDGDFLLFR